MSVTRHLADISTEESIMAGPNDGDVDPLSAQAVKTEPTEDDTNTMQSGFGIDLASAPEGFLYVKGESTSDVAVDESRTTEAGDGDLKEPVCPVKTEPADDPPLTGSSNGSVARVDGGENVDEGWIDDVVFLDEETNEDSENEDVFIKEESVWESAANLNQSSLVDKIEEVAGTSYAVEERHHTNVSSKIKKPYSCDFCESRFSRTYFLKCHMRAHTGEKPFPCDLCESSFTSSHHLKVHKRTHTGEKPYPCDLCGSRFSRAYYLKVHMRTHTGERSYPCDFCESCFRQAGDLQRHMRTHTGEKPYSCDVCESSFRRDHQLKNHMRTHTGMKPYSCEVCGSQFSRTVNLKRHMRTHTGEKPYSCDVCGSRFGQAGQLKAHLISHTGETPYSCDVCESRFRQARQLKLHKRTHTGEIPYLGVHFQ